MNCQAVKKDLNWKLKEFERHVTVRLKRDDEKGLLDLNDLEIRRDYKHKMKSLKKTREEYHTAIAKGEKEERILEAIHTKQKAALADARRQRALERKHDTQQHETREVSSADRRIVTTE